MATERRKEAFKKNEHESLKRVISFQLGKTPKPRFFKSIPICESFNNKK